ncbi:MAG: class I SAM-dependent methyltransferase [Sulfuritalea sp.]|nr:class I SAM-dependent methyltransferase [Sulfuritalea sp.]MDP1985182.1 class I SAM-dependent methyltransferase [Sulfuritalea sp.]
MTQRCSICQGALEGRLLTINDPDRFERHIGIPSAGYRRVWVVCSRCGSATNRFESFSQSRLAELETAYYDVDLVGADIGERFTKIMALPVGASDNALRVSRIAAYAASWFSNEAYSVLDIGAGTGVFLARLIQQDNARLSRAVGVEPDPTAAAHLRELGLFEVISEPFPPARALGNFQLITLNKVLEHIADPLSFIERITATLDPQCGLLYVEVPDVLTATHRPANDNILGSLHRHLYSPRGLAEVLQRAGLDVLCVERVTEPSGKLSVYAYSSTSEAISRWAGTREN